MISGIGASIPPAAQAQNSSATISISYAEWLTPEDKAIVKAAGEDIDPNSTDRTVPSLAATIAISRYVGTLTGPLTSGFLGKYAGDPVVGADATRALDYLETHTFSDLAAEAGDPVASRVDVVDLSA